MPLPMRAAAAAFTRHLSHLNVAMLGLACVALLWTLPFLQPLHYFPMPMFRSEWLAFVLGLLALILLATKRAWQHGEIPLVAVVPFGLAVIILLQGSLGRVPYFGQAVTAAFYLTWAALLVILGAELRRTFGLVRIAPVLAWALVCSGLLTAFAGILQYFEISSVFDAVLMPALGSIYGNLAQRNHFASYLVLALASASYLYAVRGMRTGVAMLVCAPLIMALGFSASRSTWLYIFAALVLAWLLRMRRRDDLSQRLVIFIEFVLLAFALDQWLMTLPLFGSLAEDGGANTINRVIEEPGLALKLQHARSAWWMFTQAPFFGVGWGQFGWYNFEYQGHFHVDILFPAPVHNAHNVVTHVLAETGLCGALLLVGGVIVWLIEFSRERFDAERWWLLSLFSIIGVHSMLEYPLWHSYFLGVAATAVGFGAKRFWTLPLQRVGSWAAALLLAGGFLNAVVIGQDYLEFERVFAISAATYDRERVARLTSIGDRDPVLEPYVELAMLKHIALDKEMLPEKLALNGHAMYFLPADMVVFRQAVLLALDGQAQAAQQLFLHAMKVYPDSLPAVLQTLRQVEDRYPVEVSPLLKLTRESHH